MWGSSITFQDYPLEACLDLMADLGFTRVEMWKHHLSRCRTRDLRAAFSLYAKSLGIEMGGFNAVGEEYFRPFEDEREKQETLTGLYSDIDFAASLGSKQLLIWEGRRPEALSPEQCRNQLLSPLAELLQDALAYANQLGLQILVEPHPFTVGMDDQFLIALYDKIDRDNFGITYDFCHYGVARPTDYIDAVRALAHRIRHLHFSDSDQQSSELHFAPGDGRMDLAGLLASFRDIGFNGTMTLDLYGNPWPVAAARKSQDRFNAACDFLKLGQSTGNVIKALTCS